MKQASESSFTNSQASPVASPQISKEPLTAGSCDGAFKVPFARRPSAFRKIDNRKPVRMPSEPNNAKSIKSYLLHLHTFFTGNEAAKNEALSALSSHPIFQALMKQRAQI